VAAAEAAARSVAFISHDAHPFGAQLFLIRLLRWLRDHSDLRFEVILGGEGPLQPDFERIARVSSLQPERPDRLSDDDPLIRRLRAANVGLIYSNTITNGKLLGALSSLECPVITHVHETGFWIRNRVSADDLRLVVDRTTRFIGGSEAMRQSLLHDVGVPPERVTVIYECIPTSRDAYPGVAAPGQIRDELGIPSDARVVLACGNLDWRKAPDLFVQLGREVRKRVPNGSVHFVWVGGTKDNVGGPAIWHDVVKAGIEDSVHMIGYRENLRDYLEASDVFVLPSREDPMPLVVLEAANAALPTVCFDRSGGAREFVEEDCGFVVPYLDVCAMADRVAEIVTQPALQRSLGRRAAEKVRQRHDIDVIAPLVLREIEMALSGASNDDRRQHPA
jgi:glycosyltransferase involved in cell wall biosynthesis